MPDIEWNKEIWNKYFSTAATGGEWSSAWGGVDMEWYAEILPRIHSFVPTQTILEIAPGAGRWTVFLAPLCDKLIIVELSENALKLCKNRFIGSPYDIEFYVNDGKSLDMIKGESVDFIFSHGSLVHSDDDAIQAYLSQFNRILTKDGAGFIHHSTAGMYLPDERLAKNIDKGRGDMTAERFAVLAKTYGCPCITQELTFWTNSTGWADCFSTFTKAGSKWERPCKTWMNSGFQSGIGRIKEMAEYYAR